MIEVIIIAALVLGYILSQIETNTRQTGSNRSYAYDSIEYLLDAQKRRLDLEARARIEEML